MTLLVFAKKYIDREWMPIPVPFKAKIPIIPAWQNLVLTKEDLPKYFNGNPLNISVLVGKKSNGLTDIDLDSREAVRIADYFLPETNANLIYCWNL